MIKVMIVDDEPKIREGLKMIVPWESLGFSVAGTASNGHEALELYDEIKPELIVADIRMPGMDGMTLIHKLREFDDKLHILILSGYADFDYAKKAIDHRADGYLLKPVDEDEIITYLTRIAKDCCEAKEKARLREATGKWTKDILIQSLLAGTSDIEVGVLTDQAKELGLPASEYQVLLIEPYPHTSHALEEIEWMDFSKQIGAYFEQMKRGISHFQHGQICILLTQTIASAQMRVQLSKELDALLDKSGLKVTSTLGGISWNLAGISTSYKEARELLKRQFFRADDGVLGRESMMQNKGITQQPEGLEDRLYYAMSIGSRVELVGPLIHSAGDWLMSIGASEIEIKSYYAELLTNLLSKLSSIHREANNCLKFHTDKIALIHQQPTLIQLYEHIDELLEEMIDAFVGLQSRDHDMKALLDIIDRNYSDNLKLDTLAGILNYNTAYLGKRFKQSTGENFNTYLDKVRMEQAKHLLQQGMKVYQVAERVGYTNVDYFHSKFRKYVGTSPSSYKKQKES